MKKLLLAAGAVVALSVQAGAADIPLKTPYRPPPVPVLYNWTGCYLGVHAGGGIYHSDFISDPEQGGNIGVVAGGQAGCNYQIRQLVVGIEGELYWTNLETKSDEFFPGSNENHNRARNRSDADIALRLGYAFDRLLVYGKIGANWGRFRWSHQEIDFPGVGCVCAEEIAAQKTNIGLLLGVGWEYAFLDNWTAKLEYNYINFGNPFVNLDLVSCTNGPGSDACETRQFNFGRTIRDTKQILKVGINYKFDLGKAPVAVRAAY